ncbi:hypothetical protein HS960_05465 [Sphingobacterium paramultivorum]|uniref:Reverse transcriptase domain-containing protein n=1 Tax=Sphingobacterium paramultivorum TaxID=2886510 RepID=A0A7G5DZG1_9SPHI|nr:reverse transcriptase domain-containing protein [Sphingobacterium paramultivorum]QMV67136.1 hypothetical protein HS960_05465 [Sphingobacterium paramultivorum]WSO15983.1 reverse transcriptase domain-containing protein [Sphingobacterium paramultivorum]
MNLKREIADKLFEIFYLDTKKYGVQNDNGSYKYIENTISPMLIQDSLEKAGSLMVYQELSVFRNSLIKWVCLDIDIEKGSQEDGDNFFLAVKEAALIVERCLIYLNVPYIIEFSGRRGFHFWIIFDEPVDKTIGYQLVNLVLDKVKVELPEGINIDLFPQTPVRSESSKGVGKGVKLPLSKHKGSGFYAYLLEDLTDFSPAGKLTTLSSEILEEQLDILNKIVYFKKDQRVKLFDLYSNEINEIITKSPFLQNYKVESYLKGDVSLDNILKDVSKCDNIKSILNGYQTGLSEKERNILVGLLINLRREDDKQFGYNLLLELFSNISGYDEEKTKTRLEGLKYLNPVSCDVLGKCSHCGVNCDIKSPVQLITNVKIGDAHTISITNFNEDYFERIRKSLYNYSLRNDEVPLYPHLKKLQGIRRQEVEQYAFDILRGGEIVRFKPYRFDRREKSKIRYLYNLDPLNNILTTYFTFLLNTFFYLEMSNYSYGYEFSKSLYNGNLYTNWFINWGKYTREIEKVLFKECYADYHLIKLDIQSFYDSIDLERLRIKLFEEAPATVKERLRKLSNEEKEAYRHLINYLINISIKTTSGDQGGLPQGPAYARYLAEIYLLGLDKLIESDFLINPKREFYYRFVDDVFIFVENEDRAKLLFNKIESWLSTNSLQMNREKTTVSKVCEFVKSGAYVRFKDDQKYDINYANKNKHILSEAQVNKALAGLREFTDDVDFGLKDNLRFFYSQFKSDKVLRSLKRKLTPKIAFSKDGRGALYLLFYQDLFSSDKKNFLELSKGVNKMEGLALTHYLHAVLKYDEDKSFMPYLALFVENSLRNPTLTIADKLLLTSLILKYDMEINLNVDNDLVMEACDQPGLKLPDRVWPMFREFLQQTIDSPKSYFNEVERIIESHEFELEFLKKFATHTFTRFTEWNDSQLQEVFADDASIVKYYHIISFLTLFVEQGLESKIWEILLDRSVERGHFQYDEEHLWVDKVSSFRLEDYTTAFYTLLFSVKGTDQLSKIPCPNNFLDNYRNILTIVMYASDKSENQSDFKKKLGEKVEDSEKSILQKWVANEYSTLYPENSRIFLRNISLNGLIALKCGAEFFVKNINNISLTTKYAYIDKHTSESYENVYQVDQTLLSESFTNLKNLSNVLNKLNQVFIDHKKFKTNYGTYPLLYTGYEIVKDHSPAVPYFSDFSKIINYNGDIVKWNTRNYLEVIFQFLKSITWIHNPQISLGNTLFNFGVKQIWDRFFLKSEIIYDEYFEFKFLEYFCKDHLNFDNIHDYQYLWSKALYQYLEEEKNRDIVKDFFKIHLDQYSEYNIDIFFGAEHSMYHSKENFLAFRNTLEQSIRIFQSKVPNFNPEFDFVKNLLDKVFLSLDKLEIDQANFEYMPLIMKQEPDYKNGNDEIYHFILGDKSVKSISIFNSDSGEFEQASSDELILLKEDKFLFGKINGDSAEIITIPNYLAKCYERILLRKGLAQRYYSAPQESPMLKDQFENPSVEHAGKSIHGITEPESLINKLSSQRGQTKEQAFSGLQFWLSMFNEDLFLSVQVFKDKAGIAGFIDGVHNCILKVLNTHSEIDDIAIINFLEDLDKLQNNNELIIALKHPGRDQNGLNQILTAKGRQRSVDFEKNFSKLCEPTFAFESIIIISDIFISGQQSEKALKHYFSPVDSEKMRAVHQKNEINEKYFVLANHENLIKNVHTIKKILFVAPFISEKFKIEIAPKLEELGIKATVECKTFGGFKPHDECFFSDSNALNMAERRLFRQVFLNRELMEKVFVFNDDDWRYHEQALEESKLDFNIILRPQSLPAKHFKPFAWQVKNGEPLLKYRKNWKRY